MLAIFRFFFHSRASLQLENLMLRKQIEILMRRQKRPRVTHRDRCWLVMLSRLSDHWQDAFLIFSPETLIRWHKLGFQAILKSYIEYYHGSRTHLELNKDCPNHRKVVPKEEGRMHCIPQVGGLHHRYERISA